jgi:hypothetical protein
MLPTENVDFAANFIGLYPSYGNVTTIATEYTQLRSFEINLRADASPVITLLAGYRHIDLNERIFAESFSSVGFPNNRFSIQAFNHLDGFQLGSEAVLWRPGGGRFRLEGSAKVGLFGDATSNYGTFDGGVATATDAHVAFMTEWGITGVVQITSHLAARVGYQGLLLDGVALASEQIGALSPTLPVLPGATTVNSGTPIYHGLVANLEYSW